MSADCRLVMLASQRFKVSTARLTGASVCSGPYRGHELSNERAAAVAANHWTTNERSDLLTAGGETTILVERVWREVKENCDRSDKRYTMYITRRQQMIAQMEEVAETANGTGTLRVRCWLCSWVIAFFSSSVRVKAFGNTASFTFWRIGSILHAGSSKSRRCRWRTGAPT